MQITLDGWKCELDGCGYEWAAKDKLPPDKCAGCKKRGWHKTKTTAEVVRESVAKIVPDGSALALRIEEIARRVFREEWNDIPAEIYVTPEPSAQVKPDIAALRAICAGNVPPSGASPAFHPLDPTQAPMPTTRQPCSYTEYDTDTGETYRCGLSEHSGKIRHTRGPKV